MDRVEKGSKEPAGFSRQPKIARVPAKPEPIEIDLHRTAVIVVDMQNAFVSKGGISISFAGTYRGQGRSSQRIEA